MAVHIARMQVVKGLIMSGATDPAACLFCDDSVKNIQAASAFGWRTARRCRRDVAEMSPRYRRGAARDAAERQPGLIQPRHAPRQRAGASARECARIAAGREAYTSARALGDPPRDMSTRALRPSSARCWWGGRTETRARRCGAPRRRRTSPRSTASRSCSGWRRPRGRGPTGRRGVMYVFF